MTLKQDIKDTIEYYSERKLELIGSVVILFGIFFGLLLTFIII